MSDNCMCEFSVTYSKVYSYINFEKGLSHWLLQIIWWMFIHCLGFCCSPNAGKYCRMKNIPYDSNKRKVAVSEETLYMTSLEMSVWGQSVKWGFSIWFSKCTVWCVIKMKITCINDSRITSSNSKNYSWRMIRKTLCPLMKVSK